MPPRSRAWRGERPAGIEGDHLAEGDPVHPVEPLEAERAAGALGRAAEDERAGDGREVAEVLEPVLRGRGPVDDEGVGVLRRRGSEGANREIVDRRSQGAVGRRRVGLGRAVPGAQELQGGAGVLGDEVDQPVDERRQHQLAGPMLNDRSTAKPSASRVWL